MINRIQTPENVRAFNIAVCERLGLSPDAVLDSGFSWTVSSDDKPAQVSLTAVMPRDEFLALADEHGVHP